MSDGDFGRREILAGLGAGAALTLGGQARAAGPARVQAPSGIFAGTTEGGVQTFRGIRYGRAARFMAPVRESNPGKVIPATAFGPICPQSRNQDEPQSEDCLFLNVWTADPHPATKSR